MKRFAAVWLLGLSIASCQSNRRNYVGTWSGRCDSGIHRTITFQPDNEFQHKTKSPGFFNFLESKHSGVYATDGDEIILKYIEYYPSKVKEIIEHWTEINWIDKNSIEYRSGDMVCRATRSQD